MKGKAWRRTGLLLLSFLSCSAVGEAEPAVPSEPYVWRNVTVGAGGFAPNIIFSRAERGLAYLRTDMGGAYRWDMRAGRWIPLQDSNPVSSYMGVESIAADPRDPDLVYLAVGMGQWGEAAILRSENRGAAWDVVPVPFKMGGNEDGRGLGERLAIDPNTRSTLFFGSRHDGLQRSDDWGRSWSKVDSFPHAGLGTPAPRSTHAGISFVLFDPNRPGSVYAGLADAGEKHLFHSADGGKSWVSLTGGPGPEMLPVKADIDGRGRLYIAYSTGIGPNGVRSGAVWSRDGASGRWSDITPDRSPAAEGGYMGLSVDRQRPGRLAVSSINRWGSGDTVWISDDDGTSWTSLKERSSRDVSASPFLRWGREEAEFGHWTAGLAIDPFDGDTIAYTTGATVYRTEDSRKANGAMLWKPWVKGIEQTAVITLVSPTGGAPLISGFGDLGGFVHERLDVSPQQMHLNPQLSNTNNLDYAGLKPEIIVRSGTLHAEQPQPGAFLAWSRDGGRTWKPLQVPPIRIDDAPPQRYDLQGEAPIHVSADGSVFIVSTPIPMATRDRGRTWSAPEGLPTGVRVIADKVRPTLFYAVDFLGGRLFVSNDSARLFAPAGGSGLPPSLAAAKPRWREAQSSILARPGHAGELWFNVGGRLYRSTDSAASFRAASGTDINIDLFGLGRAAPGSGTPAIYATGSKAGVKGVWRSVDGGARWVRINDDANQWGLRFRAISGDPRRFGRAYLATDGRGIFYGDSKGSR